MSGVKQLELTTGEDMMYSHAKSPRALLSFYWLGQSAHFTD